MRLLYALILASAAFGQGFEVSPAVIVANAADPSLRSVAAPGSLVSISFSSVGGAIPIFDPATTSVEIGGESAQILGSAGAEAVLALVPADLHPGLNNVQFTYDGQTTGTGSVLIADSTFGLFAGSQNSSNGSVQTNNLTHPGHPGDYVSLWGTGLGTATPDQVKVLLGGHAAAVVYAGPAPGLPGKDQINFQVPNDATIPDGCFVAVQVEVQGVASNTIAISKSTGSDVCTPPFDLTADQMTSLDAGGSVPFASFQIGGLVAIAPARPSLTSAGFLRNEFFDATAFPLDAQSIAIQTQPLVADDAFYGCTLSPSGLTGALLVDGIENLGAELTLTGPGTTAHILPQGFGGFYEVSLPTGPPVSSPEYLPPPYFVPGVWQVSSTGAESSPYTNQQYAAEPFQFQITLPPTLQLTNFADLQNIDSTQPLAIHWDPTGYGRADVVTVTIGPSSISVGNVVLILSEILPSFNQPTITCRSRATDGQFSIPASLLTNRISNSYLQISLTRRPDQMIRADIPFQSGGVAPGIFSYSFTESFPVQIH